MKKPTTVAEATSEIVSEKQTREIMQEILIMLSNLNPEQRKRYLGYRYRLF